MHLLHLCRLSFSLWPFTLIFFKQFSSRCLRISYGFWDAFASAVLAMLASMLLLFHSMARISFWCKISYGFWDAFASDVLAMLASMLLLFHSMARISFWCKISYGFWDAFASDVLAMLASMLLLFHSMARISFWCKISYGFWDAFASDVLAMLASMLLLFHSMARISFWCKSSLLVIFLCQLIPIVCLRCKVEKFRWCFLAFTLNLISLLYRKIERTDFPSATVYKKSHHHAHYKSLVVHALSTCFEF